jgi:hypothetical protein
MQPGMDARLRSSGMTDKVRELLTLILILLTFEVINHIPQESGVPENGHSWRLR